MAELTFGVASRTETALLEQFAERFTEVTGIGLKVEHAPTYDALAEGMVNATIDFAWLPPIVFLGLERRSVVTPLVSHPRGGELSFFAALVVGSNSRIRAVTSLPGSRIAWVDRWSASGYVLPRIHLATLGVDPRKSFREEHFHGSHEAAIRAVLEGKADVAATYINADPFGRIVKGAWSKIEGGDDKIRILTSFGPIPGDVIAARTSIGPAPIKILRDGLLAIGRDPYGSALARRIFGVDDFSPWVSDSYETLRSAMTNAAQRGLLAEILRLEDQVDASLAPLAPLAQSAPKGDLAEKLETAKHAR